MGSIDLLIQNLQIAVNNFRFLDLVDIALVSFFIYTIIKFIKDTRAAQLTKGLVFLFFLYLFSNILGLSASTYLLNSALDFGILAIIIVFQPELRSALERVGRKGFFNIFLRKDERHSDNRFTDLIGHITDATSNLSATKTGAIMVIEKNTKIGEIVKTGTIIDAQVSQEIILNLFYPKSPLHDGAIIIRDFRIAAAGCWLPLTNRELGYGLGTRHRAGVGMSEVSDALIVIVSEETGIISTVMDGELKRRITPDVLSATLRKQLIPNEEKKENKLSALLKGKNKNE